MSFYLAEMKSWWQGLTQELNERSLPPAPWTALPPPMLILREACVERLEYRSPVGRSTLVPPSKNISPFYIFR
jgi:hypothetical protein